MKVWKNSLIVIAVHTYFIYMHVFEKENNEMVEWMHVAQQLFGSRDQNSSRCSEQWWCSRWGCSRWWYDDDILMAKMMMFFISCKQHWSISWAENSVLSDFLVEFEIRTDEEIWFLLKLKFKRRRNFCLHKWEIPIFQTARDDEKTRVVKTSSLKIKDQKRLRRGL